MNKNKPKRLIKKPNSKKAVWLFAVILIVLVSAWFIYRSIQNQNIGTELSKDQNDKSQFVGGNKCVNCHQKEYELWEGSNHDNSMSVASDSSVLGDFNNTEVEFNGKKNKFYKREGRYYVYTSGVGGKMTEFEVTHTFGVRPLQQYLVPFEKGKYQCLPIAWDVNNKRWFDMAAMVYSKEELKPDSWLYWTNQSQNWNGMCAECHSTNLQKNFNPEKDSFNTTWSDINVNCEACHGPGSEHLIWADKTEFIRKRESSKGLVLNTADTTAKHFAEACAPCHSRRTSLGPNGHNTSYFDNHRPQDIMPPQYYADGQILDEDYEFASFTQSRMYTKGVRCNGCHDSHSLKLKAQDNTLCTSCHQKEKYDVKSHHFHKLSGEDGEPVKNEFGEIAAVGSGALCVNCHMPGKYYMGIDFRRDHSLRIPRPDLSEKYGIPNACIRCHSGKSNSWAIESVNKNYGNSRKFSYEIALIEGSRQSFGADTLLIALIKNDTIPEIVKAAAIGYLANYRTPQAEYCIKTLLTSSSPLLRERALYSYFEPDAINEVKHLFNLLSDSVKLVRIAAAERLSGIAKENFTNEQYVLLQKTLDEYFPAILYTSDFPSGKYNLGNYYLSKGELENALKFFNEAIKTDSMFYPAKNNLALLYYNSGEPGKAESLFMELIKKHPEYREGEYYLGLLYSEQKKYRESAVELEKAAIKIPLNAKVFYNLGLVYQNINEFAKSENALMRGYNVNKYDFDLLYALADLFIKKKDYTSAMKYANEIKEKFPANKDGIKLLNFLNRLDRK